MKNILRAVLILAFGFLLLCWPAQAADIVVKILAACLIAAGILSLVYALATRMLVHIAGMGLLTMISALVFIIVGSLMFANAAAVVKFIAYFFGAILVIYGVMQLVHTYRFTVGGKGTFSMYIVPVIILVLGIAFFFEPNYEVKILTRIFGICLILLGASELVLDSKHNKIVKEKEAAAKEVAANSAAASAAREAATDVVATDIAADSHNPESEDNAKENSGSEPAQNN